MNKNELIRTISKETERVISQEKIAMVLDKTVEVIKRTLDEGECVKWQGFGTLVMKERLPRRVYSPSEKNMIVSKGSKSIVFKEARKTKNN